MALILVIMVLMNKFSIKNIIKNLVRPKVITISPLEMTVKNSINQLKNFLLSMKFQF